MNEAQKDKRIKELEKRVTALEGQVQEQWKEKLNTKIKLENFIQIFPNATRETQRQGLLKR